MRSSRSLRRWTAVLTALALLGLSSTIGASPAQAVPGEYWVQRLSLPKVWKITRGAGVTVAVVDTGVPPTPNLRGRVLKGVDLVTHGPSGQADAGESTPYGPVSHGQEMAQLVAGNSASGYTQGIAPKAKILPVKIARSDTPTSTETIGDAGIRWAAGHGIKIINASFGIEGSTCTPDDAAAVKYAYQRGAIVVASTGDLPGAVSSPADCPGALAVAGVNSNGSNWDDSAFGPEVDVANFASKIQFITLSGQPAGSDGTSASAAFTSGELALLWAKFPKDSARDIITRLLYGIDPLSKTPIGQRVDNHIGYGVPAILSELTAKVPADAPNPVYDAWTKALGPPTTSGPTTGATTPAPGSSAGSAPASSAPNGSAPNGSAPNGSAPNGSAPASDAPLATGGSGGGSNSTLIIVLVVVVALVLIVVAVVFTQRTKNRRGPYPPAGYGLPPQGGPPPPPPRY